mmetsp:Transcript_15243/g.35327  ORF Transcript_15243/g.35327 Transcript_15243/m.35327 type:complete len:479 (-) Transcript_15243:255-1691(-)
MIKFSTSTASSFQYCVELYALVMSFRVVRMTDGFSIFDPTVSDAKYRIQFSLENNLAFRAYKDDYCPRQQYFFRLFASTNGKEHERQPIGHRSYDFIAIEEADKMLQDERLRNEREIQEMKHLLERQHQELLELDGLTFNVELANQDYIDTIDLSISAKQDDKCNDGGKSSFSPFSTSVDEEQYKQTYQRSHNAAEWRTLKISLQQIDEENEELEKELDDREHCYQSDVEEKQRMICDIRDRFDCMQHELKLEISHFERAKVELEEMLEQERSKFRELEQQLLVARRGQEILEQVAAEAQQRQQRLQDQEKQEELEQQQRIIQLEHEEQEQHHQQKMQEQERYYHEELLRNHEELVELEKHQKQLDDVYLYIRDDSCVDKDNQKQNQSHREKHVVAVNSRQEVRQPESFIDSAPSINSPQPMDVNTVHQQQLQQQHSFRVAVTTQASEPLQSKRDSKRYSRKNSHAHGIFMNFNDILV